MGTARPSACATTPAEPPAPCEHVAWQVSEEIRTNFPCPQIPTPTPYPLPSAHQGQTWSLPGGHCRKGLPRRAVLRAVWPPDARGTCELPHRSAHTLENRAVGHHIEGISCCECTPSPRPGQGRRLVRPVRPRFPPKRAFPTKTLAFLPAPEYKRPQLSGLRRCPSPWPGNAQETHGRPSPH